MQNKKPATVAEPLKLVPFNAKWIDHEKIDIHAIYRRPKFYEDEFGEKYREYDNHGAPSWDLTGGLPVRQHNKWLAKGFEYVTLSDIESLLTAARFGTIDGDWKQYNQHQTGGPWSYKKYLAGQHLELTREHEQLKADVEEFGSAVVERIRRQTDANFQLPERMRNIPAGGKVPDIINASTEPPAAIDLAPVAAKKGK